MLGCIGALSCKMWPDLYTCTPFCPGYSCSGATIHYRIDTYITATNKEAVWKLHWNLPLLLFLSICVGNNSLCTEVCFIF